MDIGRAEQAARRALAAAPSPVYEGIALAGLGQALYLKGRTREAVATLRQAVGQIPDTNPLLLAVAVGNLGLAESALATSTSRADPMLDQVLALLSQDRRGPHTGRGDRPARRGERDRRGGDLRSAVATFQLTIGILQANPRSAWLANAYLLAGGGSSTARRTDAGRDRP